ncbi:MAG: D-alanyl-D-alanine carboxypeptidase family protein [Thermoanaerobacteraceae bacterium]|nr:D-alanyl-D-alanine carboxypeptidase family protein [Thermoanaerobacteraceae bacterium]
MKKFLTIFLLSTVILTSIPFTETFAEDIDISAPSAALIDFNTGQILYEKNANQKMYPASITKILTAIIALENSNLNEQVTAGDDVLNVDGNKIYISPGETLSMKDLVYSLLIASANDSAIVIADHIGGSIKGFTDIMNKKAAEIGAKNTNFTNPNGLHEDNHYTTARDMALIARYAMQNETFRNIVTTAKYTIQPTNKFDKVRELYCENKLLKNTKYKYEGADGIKTGYTIKANQTLVASATRDGHRIIAVIMGAKGTKVWEDAIKLLDYGFANYKLVSLNEKNQTITTMKLDDLEIALKTDDKFEATVPSGAEDITKKINISEDVSFPIQAGAVLGKLEYYIGDKLIGHVNLITDKAYQKGLFGNIHEIDNDSEKGILNDVAQTIFIVLILILVVLVLLFFRRIRHRKKFMFKKSSGW